MIIIAEQEDAQELTKAAENLNSWLSEVIDVEKAIDREVEQDEKVIQQRVMPEIESVQNEQKEEISQLKAIRSALKDIHENIEREVADIEQGSSDDDEEIALESNIQADIQDAVENYLQPLETELSDDSNKVGDELEEAIRIVTELKSSYNVIQELKPSIKSARLTEEAIKKIAQSAGLDSVLNVLRQSDEEVRTAEQWEQQLESDEEQLEQLLERVDQAINQEESLSKSEIEAIRTDLTGDQKLFKEMKNTLEPLLNKEHEGEKTGNAQKIVGHINKIEGELNSIDQHLEKILKVKNIETKEEDKATQAVESIIDEMNHAP